MEPFAERPWASIVALNGSFRADGLTALVLRELSAACAARDVRMDVLPLRDFDIRPCGACGDCNTRNVPCEQADDVPELVRRMGEYDGVLYATPVYGFGQSSLMQTFIERAGVGHLRFNRPLANKVAGIVVTGRRYSHDRVYGQLIDNVLLNRMIVAGSGFPAFVYGQIGDEPGQDREGMTSAVLMVERMMDLLSVLLFPHSGRDDVEFRLGSLPRNERVAVPGPRGVTRRLRASGEQR